MRIRFDRGTILLEDPPAAPDVTDLPGVLWDPRVSALRAPALHLEAIRAELARRGVRAEDLAGRPADLPEPVIERSLRPYQDAALWAWRRAGRRGLIVLPTGSGKTRLATAAVAELHGPAIVIVPTRVLLDQWIRELEACYPGPIGQLGDGQHRVEAITVATFESAWRQMARIGDRFRLLVVDEVHHFGDGQRDEALELCAAPARLGLTATPPRPPSSDRLEALIGPISFELTVSDLAGRWLAPFELVTLRLDLDPEERAAWTRAAAAYRPVLLAFQRAQPGARWPDFVRHASRTYAGRQALAAFRESRALLAYPAAKRRAVAELLSRHARARILVFTSDNATAYSVARDNLVMPITCDVSRPERDAALERFRRGELRVLVSAKVLNEGLDVPDAEVAIVVGGAGGEREHVQRIGRLLRPREGKAAVVYELVMRATPEVQQVRRRRAGLAPRQPSLV